MNLIIYEQCFKKLIFYQVRIKTISTKRIKSPAFIFVILEVDNIFFFKKKSF